MKKEGIQKSITRLKRPAFTTSELAGLSGKSLSAVTQSLRYLEKQGVVSKVYRGIWIEANNPKAGPYSVIPLIFAGHRAYVSFTSALHLHHIIEQIPQVITLASTSRTRTVKTKIGTFCAHQIAPPFFKGFDWYGKTGTFLIAEPEKALVDCLYLSAYKKKQFGYFPELHFSPSFSMKKARYWAGIIPNPKVKTHVLKKIAAL